MKLFNENNYVEHRMPSNESVLFNIIEYCVNFSDHAKLWISPKCEIRHEIYPYAIRRNQINLLYLSLFPIS
jgi:hypothetical protein